MEWPHGLCWGTSELWDLQRSASNTVVVCGAKNHLCGATWLVSILYSPLQMYPLLEVHICEDRRYLSESPSSGMSFRSFYSMPVPVFIFSLCDFIYLMCLNNVGCVYMTLKYSNTEMVAEWQFENCIELLFTTSDLIFCVFFLNGKMVLICPVEMCIYKINRCFWDSFRSSYVFSFQDELAWTIENASNILRSILEEENTRLNMEPLQVSSWRSNDSLHIKIMTVSSSKWKMTVWCCPLV
jgi:hypothetical protein